jgi:hypothetical protein
MFTKKERKCNEWYPEDFTKSFHRMWKSYLKVTLSPIILIAFTWYGLTIKSIIKGTDLALIIAPIIFIVVVVCAGTFFEGYEEISWERTPPWEKESLKMHKRIMRY